MALFDVLAVAIDRQTGSVVAGPRVERIDTLGNELFADCADERDVREAYEAFWDALKGHCRCGCPEQAVRVLDVRRITGIARAARQ